MNVLLEGAITTIDSERPGSDIQEIRVTPLLSSRLRVLDARNETAKDINESDF
jgi:hypothetical protein